MDWNTMYQAGAVVGTVFISGFYLNSKLKNLCKDTNQAMENTMSELMRRVSILEKDYIPISKYEKDLLELKDLIKEVKNDVREGMHDLSIRIDAFINGRH